MEKQRVGIMLERIRSASPLIHNITNLVVTNFTANGLLALGASPVMAYAKEEVADMAKLAGALVLNIGTLDERNVEAMLIAGKAANQQGVPVVLDPVGAGATPYRTETARLLASRLKVDVLRGNTAEIANLIGSSWQIKGVDAGDGDGDAAALARSAAEQLKTTVVVTGKTDWVSDAEGRFLGVANGHPLLTKVTGAGCLLSAVIGAFAAVEHDYFQAAAAALSFYGICAEEAAKGISGPGSFAVSFLDALYHMRSEDLAGLIRWEGEI